jgi:hypothetical protein
MIGNRSKVKHLQTNELKSLDPRNSRYRNTATLLTPKNCWSRVVREAGGKSVERLFTTAEDRLDFILSDDDPLEINVAKVKELKMPLLTTDWLLETLILGRPVEDSGRYHYDIDNEGQIKPKTTSIENSPRKQNR